MSLIPCDFCRKRVPEKLCQVTWAWYDANGDRVAYRQRLCTQCFCTNLLPMDVPTDFESLTCPACHISTSEDMDPCYATAYIPGQGKQSFELPTCAPCAVRVRVAAQQGSSRLEDRGPVEGPGPSPSTQSTRESYWSGIGIIPREPVQ